MKAKKKWKLLRQTQLKMMESKNLRGSSRPNPKLRTLKWLMLTRSRLLRLTDVLIAASVKISPPITYEAFHQKSPMNL